MGIFVTLLAAVVGIAALGALIGWIYANVRVHRLMRGGGSFSCSIRRDATGGWTSAIGCYGSETLDFYRLVGVGSAAEFTMRRGSTEVSAPANRAADGSLVEVSISDGGQRWGLTIATPTYSGIVSWIESAPPQDRSIY